MLTDASITQSKPNLTARPTPETDQSLKYAPSGVTIFVIYSSLYGSCDSV